MQLLRVYLAFDYCSVMILYFQHGNVAMHYAAKGGYLDLVRFLKANGAKLNIKNQVNHFLFICNISKLFSK